MEFGADGVSTVLAAVGSTLLFILALFSILFSRSDQKDVLPTRPRLATSEILVVGSIAVICILHLAWTGIFGAMRAGMVVTASELVGIAAWTVILV